MKKKWMILLALLLVLVLVGLWGFNVGSHTYHLMQIRQEVKDLVQGDLGAVSPSYAFSLLHGVNDDLTVLDKNLKIFYPVLNLFNGTLAQIQPAIVYLDSWVDYALLIEEKISPLISHGINSQVDILQFLNGVFEENEFIRQAIAYSMLIPQNRAALDISLLPLRFQDDFLLLDKYLPLLQSSAAVLPYLREMIGMDTAANYLFLALNQDELRGGGGFITAMGTVSIRNLANIDFDLQDSYQFDDLSKDFPLPPQPMQTFLRAAMWLSRDGNWSADFPTSAQKVQELFRISNDAQTMGVIAFDQEAVRQLVRVVGRIQIDPQNDIWVDETNVIEFMQESWGSNSDQENWWSNRKNFINVLGKTILETITASRDVQEMIELGKVAGSLLRSGHLMVYFNNPKLQALLSQYELDNAVASQGGDFVYWVDSNIGFNKVDAVVKRSLRYEVDLTDLAQPKARLVMKFVHPLETQVVCEHISSYGEDIAYSNMLERCYWDYWRVYRPQGSQVTTANLASIPSEWLINGQSWQGPLDQESDLPGFSMAGGMMVLPTYSAQEIALAYNLPKEVIEIREGIYYYQLELVKQLGLNELPIALKILIPQGSKFLSYPENMVIQDQTGSLHENLTESHQKYEISFGS
jgi:hypothetical protein